ncbi:hypothetical protein D1872_277860 [compost metagenome]
MRIRQYLHAPDQLSNDLQHLQVVQRQQACRVILCKSEQLLEILSLRLGQLHSQGLR